MIIRKRHYLPAVLVAVASFCLFAFIIFFYLSRAQEIWEKDERTRLIRILNNKRSSLESELYARIYYTKSVAAYVSLRPGIKVDEFFNLANELIQDDAIIKTMSLAKGGVIGAVFPPEGNEAVIGLDLFHHKERREIVEQTIASGKTFVAGPVELVEGGIAFISYTPIFDKSVPGASSFWGITDIVIKKNELIAAADISELESGVRLAIRGYDGKGEEGAVFFGDAEIFEYSPVTVSAKLPDGEWIIAALPEAGWSGYLDQDRIFFIVLTGSGLIISVLLGLFASAVYRIRSDALQMGSIFKAMTGWILEIDRDFKVVWRAPTRSRDLELLNHLQIGESLLDSIPQLSHEAVRTLNRCLSQKTIESFELKIEVGPDTCWMLVTVSPKGDDHLILVVQEITLQKEQQAKLIESENELLRLNANKDRLFSIIAHDLRTPFSAITGLSDQLLQKRERMPEEEQRESLELIYQSGKENLHLLDNLLNWARSQQERLVINPEEINLQSIAAKGISIFRELAALKGIRLINRIEPEVIVSFDRQMLEAVFRNLISNAIKFSSSGDVIEVGIVSPPAEGELPGQIEVFVADSGVGMDAETLKLVSNFGTSTTFSSVGTNNESGAGLGLSLCKDFLALHDQGLRIVSAPNEGTTIYFTVALTG